MSLKLQDNFTETFKSKLFSILKEVVSDLDIKAYVIGGFVRDHLLNREEKNDVDIVAIGSGIDLAHAVQKKLIGAKPVKVFKTYGTAMIQWNNIDLEFVGARKESYNYESRNPKVSSGTLEDDQNRRDFSVNALAISLNKEDFGKKVDPFQGLEDLKKKIFHKHKH